MKRIPQLDGVRALAILAVFLHHAFDLKGLWMGVDLFFVLSGFLITGVLFGLKNLSAGGFWGHFYERRARRILPPYLLFLVVATVFAGPLWLKHWYLYILLTNLILPLHIPNSAPFIHLWSLAVEEQFYLLWPLAVYFLDEKKLKKLTLLLIVGSALLRGIVHFHEHWFIYALTPFRMDLLACGALLCIEWRNNRDRITRYGSAIGLPLVAIGVIGLEILSRLHITTYGNSRLGNVFIYEASFCICGGFMLYALSGWKVGWLTIAPLRYIGQISYSMYLVHVGILRFTGAHFSIVLSAAVAFAITIAYASASWYLMEKPLLRSKKEHPQLKNLQTESAYAGSAEASVRR